MREIKFRAEHKGKIYNVQTRLPKIMRSKRYKGWYKQQGYIARLITEHPHATKRGYVLEHRLVMEQHLGRFLKPNEEFVHHIDQNRSNNHISNLQLQGGQNWHAKGHLRGSRNPHGQFICNEPIFDMIKFRLLNINTGLTTIYTLNKLIATTFRKGQFKFRGRFTGRKDKNGKEIYQGDIVHFVDPESPDRPKVHKSIVQWFQEGCCYEYAEIRGNKSWGLHKFSTSRIEILGDIHTTPDLMENT